MPSIRIPRPWELPERLATPESVYFRRRLFLRQAGLGGLGLAVAGCAGGSERAEAGSDQQPPLRGPGASLYPAARNARFVLDRDLTDEAAAAASINYYEFTTDKRAVADVAKRFRSLPWSVEVGGLVEKPRTFDIEELVKAFPLEERLYRHRCVEAWAMAVPWTGFPLERFIRACQPLSSARFVRFVSFMKPEEAPGQKTQPWYPWPYFEGLTLAEATNDLAMLVTGIYGHPLPNHHGAPLRLVVPWKYGYKSAKGIVRVEFTDHQPPTFWNEVAPTEYGFTSNVNPAVPHPRWSQARETLLGTGRVVDTLPYNGYAEFVAHLYA